MDGYETTTRLRDMESSRDHRTPVIALTAHAMPGDRERCLSVGMDDYVAKPVTVAKLREVLDRWSEERIRARKASAVCEFASP